MSFNFVLFSFKRFSLISTTYQYTIINLFLINNFRGELWEEEKHSSVLLYSFTGVFYLLLTVKHGSYSYK